jgi:cell division septation protein DedD
MSRNDSDSDDRYVEIQLDGKQIIVVLAGILLLCAVSFHFGRRVGRADGGRANTDLAALVDNAAGGEEALSDEDAASDLTFFDTVGQRAPEAAPPEVASGTTAKRNAPVQPKADTPPPPVPQAKSAESPPVAPPAATTARAPVGAFMVQVAAYSDRARAEALVGRLRQKGYAALIATVPANGQTLYKVRVGGFSDRPAADAAKVRLANEEKLQAWVVAADS